MSKHMFRCQPHAGPVPVDDEFTIPADKELKTNVTSNDEGLPAAGLFTYVQVKAPTVTKPGSTLAVALTRGFSFTATGQLTFSPLLAGKLQPGAVVTWVYAIRSGGVRSATTATVTITVAAATGPFPPPPPPPLGTGERPSCACVRAACSSACGMNRMIWLMRTAAPGSM